MMGEPISCLTSVTDFKEVCYCDKKKKSTKGNEGLVSKV